MFVNAISCLRRVLALLTLLHVPVFALHAQMQQRQRLKNLDRFKVPTFCVSSFSPFVLTSPQISQVEDSAILLCTDVAARGLDIPSVPHVVHYQLPRSSETYVHRSGRTARAGAQGLSLALVDETDSNMCLPSSQRTYF